MAPLQLQPSTNNVNIDRSDRWQDELTAAIAHAIASGHVIDETDDHSPWWHDDDLPTSPEILTEPRYDWHHVIVEYLRAHGLTVSDVVDSLGARPVWLLDRGGRRCGSPAAQHQMFQASGPAALSWTLAWRAGKFHKFSAPGSGHAISVAAPHGASQIDIADAKEIGICEGPFKASAWAISTDTFGVAGHGVQFGAAALDTLLALAGSRSTKRRLRGRKIFIVGDEGDLAAGHADVHHAVGRVAHWAITEGARVHVVRHPR